MACGGVEFSPAAWRRGYSSDGGGSSSTRTNRRTDRRRSTGGPKEAWLFFNSCFFDLSVYLSPLVISPQSPTYLGMQRRITQNERIRDEATQRNAIRLLLLLLFLPGCVAPRRVASYTYHPSVHALSSPHLISSHRLPPSHTRFISRHITARHARILCNTYLPIYIHTCKREKLGGTAFIVFGGFACFGWHLSPSVWLCGLRARGGERGLDGGGCLCMHR
ncbi:uncharacterized protein K452DRAFT_145281 [Aplosporella prunicola CBS 121167]|uniref:Uncharacterized protein n=1 Tax=Aplosporella prunicola CBS 121167 TaxID=1176127 RepID=A0A6A6BKL0_9PEZI|nr:uncharacterized protein K452DRAFT_145281 [Aplosporella prunicola CBS 121167]KAF2144662.1 hypothetical protein K452DRAFT_145281 [Aplosporella prunicola CBS 121167]